ncbi:MAG TPA: DNA polymerase III subunit gamma/tau, partial [Clostridiaceae bacterium]|nr:DNA polymerase III subunit gamma/tau [Clostridiaceae bacterium]
IFILATTDPQKVPPTILSRCQRFDFKRIKKDDMVKRLRMVADENGVLVEDKTLNLISSVSDGAMRDALSIFDQSIAMSDDGKVEYKDVEEMLGLTSDKYLFDLVSYMINRDVDNSVKLVDDIISEGKDNMQFISSLIKHFRNLLMVKVSNSPEELIDASDDTIKMLKDQARGLRSEEILRAINIMVNAENEMK